MMEDWVLHDTLTTIQSQMQDVDRIILRSSINGCISGDSKRKVCRLLDDIKQRFESLPEDKGK